MRKIDVLIVDDHRLVREGLFTYLNLHEDIEIVGEAENGLTAVSLVRQHQPGKRVGRRDRGRQPVPLRAPLDVAGAEQLVMHGGPPRCSPRPGRA